MANIQFSNEIHESEVDSFQAEQCHEFSESRPVVAGLEIVEEPPKIIDPGPENKNSHEPSETLAAFQAIKHKPGSNGVDFRPHIYDSKTSTWILLDSGSMVSCVPPDPGDKPVPNRYLKAVNGSRIRCFGEKKLEIRIGRKTYFFNVLKAEVDSPVLGWDFIRHYRFDFIWNEFGDIMIRDKKSGIESFLNFKSIPSDEAAKSSNLEPVFSCAVNPRKYSGVEANELVFQVASVQDLTKVIKSEKENINDMPDSPYKQLLLQFPKVLEQNFSEENTASSVIHRINTKDNKPLKAKTRRLLPNSPKAVKAKEAWDQLLELGIIERVDPSKGNTWLSPIHFAVKPNGELRPVGDYRDLNAKTDLDLYPLPHLRDFTLQIAGSTIFSKLDLFKAFHQLVIDPRDRFKTALATPWGQFQFKRLAMGMRNSAQSFQRWVDNVIGDLPNVFCYLDDILVYNKSEQEHLQTIKILLERLSNAGLSISLSKCEFGKDNLEYLGYQINSQGIAPIKKKITALENFPPPTKQKECLAFLGALNYYRASLPRLEASESAAPVSESRSPAAVLDPLYKVATCKLKKRIHSRKCGNQAKFFKMRLWMLRPF